MSIGTTGADTAQNPPPKLNQPLTSHSMVCAGDVILAVSIMAGVRMALSHLLCTADQFTAGLGRRGTFFPVCDWLAAWGGGKEPARLLP